MYPYALMRNPYPSAPTPSESDVCVLGGKRHKGSKSAVLSCVEDLNKKISENHNSSKHFRLITIIHDVGSGKTHLALHLKASKELSARAVVSFTDLSQIYPRNISNIYKGMLMGFDSKYMKDLRRAILYFLKDKAEKDVKNAKKIFNYGKLDFIRGKSLTAKLEQILGNKIEPNYSALVNVLREDFSFSEISIIKMLIADKFMSNSENVDALGELVDNISALSRINLIFLNKVTVFEIDEFDCNKQSMDIIKAVINAHLPSTLLLLIMTPSSYEEIRTNNASLFDRLEKANYKIDLAGSNTLDEITDIVLEYIKCGEKEKSFTPEDEKDLVGKIKILYDEFPDFRNIRSMINMMYHTMEYAAKRRSLMIDEQSLDETITIVYPGLSVRDSIMAVPLSEFMKIVRNSNDVHILRSEVCIAIRDLVNCAYNTGSISEPMCASDKDSAIEVTYNDSSGSKTGIAILLDRDRQKLFENLSDKMKPLGMIDKLVVLTNVSSNAIGNRTTVVKIDKHMMIDLIYFSNKYKNNQIMHDDIDRALALAKSMRIC